MTRSSKSSSRYARVRLAGETHQVAWLSRIRRGESLCTLPTYCGGVACGGPGRSPGDPLIVVGLTGSVGPALFGVSCSGAPETIVGADLPLELWCHLLVVVERRAILDVVLGRRDYQAPVGLTHLDDLPRQQGGFGPQQARSDTHVLGSIVLVDEEGIDSAELLGRGVIDLVTGEALLYCGDEFTALLTFQSAYIPPL